MAGTKECPGRTRLDQTCSAACIQELVRGVFTEKTCPTVIPQPPPTPARSRRHAKEGGCGCRVGGVDGRSGSVGWWAVFVVLALARAGIRKTCTNHVHVHVHGGRARDP